MAPVKPQASRSSSQRESFTAGDERESAQAGRSASNLHAQLSAASMRASDQQSTAQNLLRKKNRARTPTIAALAPPLPPSTHPSPPPLSTSPSSGRDSTADPHLRNALSTGSSDSASTGSNGSSEGRRTKYAQAAEVAISAGLPPPPHASESRPPQMIQQASSATLARMSTPITVRDLGQDYTRYYNPFATRNNSASDVTTTLPRYYTTTATSTDVDGIAEAGTANPSKRLSDPFDDDKSISGINLFDSDPEPKQPPVTAVVSRMTSNPTKPVVEHRDSEKPFYPIYLDDRLGAPGAEKQGYNFPLYASEKEPDDDIHMPMIDDDKTMRAHWKEHFNRDTFITTLGLVFMVVGLLSLFIVLPVLSATGVDILGNDGYETPLDQMWGSTGSADIPVTWATINNSRTWPLLQNLRTGLIDPDTPESAYTRTALDGSEYKLVFSDEFSYPNRTFYPGDDPYFFAPDVWYGATQDLEWYSPDAVTTWEGSLELRLDAFPNNGLQYRSGMLNSWNQLCFKGGIYEVSVSLPGPGGVHGLWPGVWSMGNLGRPGYLATTDGMWPYTYNDCDAGITPNQSSPDGMNMLPGQRLTSCGCAGEDHATPGTGRGAPEIDIIEVSGDWGGEGIAVATQSFQVAPFDIWWYPDYEFMETPNYATSFVNTYTGGPYQQAVSTTTMLNNSWYDGILYQQYAYEYTPGADANSSIAWWVGDEMVMRFDARALRPNGNIGQRLISEEPMSLVMNLGISHSWVDINFAALKFPTIMRIDYVRWYQKEGEELVTCDPPGYETTEYIKKHPEAYNNPNYTHWTDIPGYTWPKNTLMNEC